VLLNQPTLAKAVEEGKPFQLFEWSTQHIQVTAPWYYFGGGIKLKHQATELRFGFGRPASSSRGLAGAAAELQEVGTMRSRGKLWAKALSNATPRKSGDA
jgi:hypothetical protein